MYFLLLHKDFQLLLYIIYQKCTNYKQLLKKKIIKHINVN